MTTSTTSFQITPLSQPTLAHPPSSPIEHELASLRQSHHLAELELSTLRNQQAEFARSEDFIRAILDEVPPLLILDADLRIVMANRSFYSHFRVTPAQTEEQKIYDLGNRQWDIPKLRLLLEEVLPRNSFFTDFEITHDFPSLGCRTILLSARRLDDLQRILVNFEDVTERLYFQVASRRSEIRYRRLFEAARDGILIMDPVTRKITDCNPYILDLLGYAKEEMLGRELWQIGLLKDEQSSQQAFRDLQASGYIRYEDLPLKSKTGLSREVEFVSNLYSEHGARVIQCNIRDISERKRNERTLALNAAQLETQVAERTSRLTELVGELEMFSYSVAHDMRAPLRAMAGFAQILLEDYGPGLPPEGQNQAAYIAAAAARMDMLIQDVLTYTTVLRGDMEFTVVNLDSLVRQLIQAYPELHAPRVEIQIQSLLPKVLGHPAAISQCLSNLLTNAVKFVPPGVPPLVKIRAVENDGHVRLWVEDNGIGIDPKDHKRIFDLFQRVSNDYEGTGIGLTIVRKSITRLHGQVGLESAVGTGSKFWLEFKRIP